MLTSDQYGAQPSQQVPIAEDWPLICLECGAPLLCNEQACVCSGCSKSYPIQDGVIRFVPPDPFYENRYPPLPPLRFRPNERQPWGLGLLYLVSMHYFWYIRRYIPTSARILDVASGSGMHFLAARGRVAGLDISFSSARQMATIYDLALQANGRQVPLDKHSLDAVVSHFFLEHVPPGEKPRLLAEFARLRM
jgi:hypothetical protein